MLVVIIQEQLVALSRQVGQLVARKAESERQRAEKTAIAAAMRVAQKAKEERRKDREVAEWNSRISRILAVREL